MQGEDVGDGVCALVCRALDGVARSWDTLVVGDCGPGFQAVAEDVEARGGVHGGRHGAGVERVADAECGLEVAVCDTGFGALGD